MHSKQMGRNVLPPYFSTRIDELRKMYCAPSTCVAHVLCDQYPADKVAFKIVDENLDAVVLTYGELKEESERLAAALYATGVLPGDRVATLMGKSREYLITLMAIWRMGAVHVPLFTAFAGPQIAFRLAGSNAKVVVCDESQSCKVTPTAGLEEDQAWKVICTSKTEESQLDFDEILRAQRPGYESFTGGADHPIIQLYTSGTTGTPKGVIMPTKALASFRAYMEFSLDIRKDDVFWSAADPGWAYGLFTAIFGTMTTGVSGILLAGGFSPESTVGTMEKYGVTNFTAAPTVYRALKSSGIDVPKNLSLRSASSAGEPLTPDVNAWSEKTLGVVVHDHYGQTEMGMMIGNHHHPELKQPIKPGSMGTPMPGFKAVILKLDDDKPASVREVGRLAIDLSASPLTWFSGYAGLDEKTREKFSADDSYYYTGDVAEMDEEGSFFFSSRDDDVIIMAGYRIGPFEIESTLSMHDAVAESAAVARPDEIRGEVLEAFVVLADNFTASSDLEDDLKSFVKTNFAAHAYPRRIHFTDALPKTPSGKVQRFLLRSSLGQS